MPSIGSQDYARPNSSEETDLGRDNQVVLREKRDLGPGAGPPSKKKKIIGKSGDPLCSSRPTEKGKGAREK